MGNGAIDQMPASKKMMHRIWFPTIMGMAMSFTYLPPVTEGAIFWEDNFDDGALNDTWDVSACGPPASYPQGCNAHISNKRSVSGSNSLLSEYHPTNPEIQGGTYYDRGVPPTDDIWIRNWYRTEANPPGTSFRYANANEAPISPVEQVASGAGGKYHYIKGTGSGNRISGFFINFYGDRAQGFSLQNHYGPCPNNGFGPYDSCNYYPNRAAVQLQDNTWYCVEYHVKLNTPGREDGIIEVFVNGVLSMGYYDVLARGPVLVNGNGPSSTFDRITHYTQYNSGLRYTDDLAVGNTRIGCNGGKGFGDPPPPAMPNGLTAR
jgi:hypothetical protein